MRSLALLGTSIVPYTVCDDVIVRYQLTTDRHGHDVMK